ncbi:MAG: DUF368 domain-containing protein [Cellvibrionaceae bacterium]
MDRTRSFKDYFSLFLRGLAMGAADVVPGVSGGTIAFITGIYTELIDSLRSFDHRALQCLRTQGVEATWAHINGNFLLAVFAGVLTSIVSLAKLVVFLLETQPILVWSLFFGLVLASSLILLRQVPKWSMARAFLLIAGVLIAIAVSMLKPTQLPDTWWVLALAGSVAICAMILPGISGGFLLLMMGLYSTVVAALSQLQLSIMLPFALGCGLGLLLFSHLLSWLLHHWKAETMALLTGVLLGSLNIIWPWKHTLESIQDRHGEWVPVVQENLMPLTYAQITGQNSDWVTAAVVALMGAMLVVVIEWMAKTPETDT